MAQALEQITQNLDDTLKNKTVDSELISDYLFDLSDILKADNKISPKNWNEISQQRAETFQKYAEQIPSLFNRLEAIEIQNAIEATIGSDDNNSIYSEIISQQMSQVMQNIPQEQIHDVLKGIDRYQLIGRKNVSNSMLTSLLQRKDLSYQNLYNVISCIQTKELVDLYEQKLQQMPEAPEGSIDRQYQDNIKSRFKRKSKQIQAQENLESNTPASYWSEVVRVTNSSKTDSDLQTNMSSMMARWQGRISSLSPEQGKDMSLALYKAGLEDRNNLYTNYIVDNMLAIAGSAKNNQPMLQDIEDLIHNAHDDKQLSTILSTIGNDMYFGNTGDKQTDFSAKLEAMLLQGMQNGKAGERTMNVLATMLSNTKISETTRATFREHIGAKYESLKGPSQASLNIQAQIAGKLRRYDQRTQSQSSQPTVGQRVGAKIGEKIDNVIDTYQETKQHISEKAAGMANRGRAVRRLNRMKFNRDKEAVKQMFAEAKSKAAEFKQAAAAKIKGGAEAVAETSFVLAFGVKELASMGYNAAKDKINGAVSSVKNAINSRITKAKNKINNGVNNVKTKVGNGVRKAKNFGKKVWNGVKTTAMVTAYVAAAPVILPYKAAKWGIKKISNGVKAIRNGYKNLKNRALGITDEVAQDKDTAIKQTTTEKKVSRLNAQQVAAAWEQVRDDGNAPLYSKECDSHYSISGYAEKYLDDIRSGKMTLSPENAQLAATFLGISMEVQDKVNHNKVVDKEERNRNLAAQLEQFGIKNPYKTEETKEQEEQTQSQTPPVQDKPKEKEIPALNPEQAKIVESELKILKDLGQKNGLKPTDDMYKGLVVMMERGFAEKGITAEQMGVIRENNPALFPPKEKPQPETQAEQQAEQPAQKKPRETEQPTPQPVQEKPKETEQPAPQPAQEKPKEVEQPAPQTAPKNPQEAEKTPDPKNPETYNFAGLTGNEGVSAAPERTEPKRRLSPEERAARYERRMAKKILQAQGRQKPKETEVKNSEIDSQVLSKALMGNTLE